VVTPGKDFNEYFFICDIFDGEMYNVLLCQMKKLKKKIFEINYRFKGR